MRTMEEVAHASRSIRTVVGCVQDQIDGLPRHDPNSLTEVLRKLEGIQALVDDSIPHHPVVHGARNPAAASQSKEIEEMLNDW